MAHTSIVNFGSALIVFICAAQVLDSELPMTVAASHSLSILGTLIFVDYISSADVKAAFRHFSCAAALDLLACLMLVFAVSHGASNIAWSIVIFAIKATLYFASFQFAQFSNTPTTNIGGVCDSHDDNTAAIETEFIETIHKFAAHGQVTVTIQSKIECMAQVELDKESALNCTSSAQQP